ncbi:unnamed protein product [Vicia faba]|uniref:Uncharacterized protein n=1 Tax=Vicia faba TaxID=3906 RepID=A0AAV0YX78_VICFA|nr:unnamed protein product [Vicia faba]
MVIPISTTSIPPPLQPSHHSFPPSIPYNVHNNQSTFIFCSPHKQQLPAPPFHFSIKTDPHGPAITNCNPGFPEPPSTNQPPLQTASLLVFLSASIAPAGTTSVGIVSHLRLRHFLFSNNTSSVKLVSENRF